jgi:8-oxo-dGTP pyrophosphatase MutT (NUDIX family)
MAQPKTSNDASNYASYLIPKTLSGRRLASTIFLQSNPASASSTILAVSRRGDASDFGLPGGKLDPHEADVFDFEGAAIRELFEETGIRLEREDVQLCFAGQERPGENDSFVTHTYRVKAESAFYQSNEDPERVEIRTEEEGRVAWVGKDALLAGCFGNYNRRLFGHLGILDGTI